MIDDPFDLQRFIDAQDGNDPQHPGMDWDDITSQLATGHKRGHWMWFVFPQVDLGHTPTSHHFAITSADEARAYLSHPVLGERLRRCTSLVLDSGVRDATQIFGHIDRTKFRSSMTLFHLIDPDEPHFERALAEFFGGRTDPHTVTYLTSFH